MGKWFEDAKCKGKGPSLFFWEGLNRVKEQNARVFCRTCPVRYQCLISVWTDWEPHGIRAGLSPKERKAFRILLGGRVPQLSELDDRLDSLLPTHLRGNGTTNCIPSKSNGLLLRLHIPETQDTHVPLRLSLSLDRRIT